MPKNIVVFIHEFLLEKKIAFLWQHSKQQVIYLTCCLFLFFRHEEIVVMMKCKKIINSFSPFPLPLLFYHFPLHTAADPLSADGYAGKRKFVILPSEFFPKPLQPTLYSIIIYAV